MVTIDLCTPIHAPIERCFDLARSIELHLLGTEHTGEQAVAGVTTGLIGPDQFVRWRARHFGIWQHLASRITAFDRLAYFQDTMTEGAFRFMQHDHFFKESASGITEMCDRFQFAAPLGILGPRGRNLAAPALHDEVPGATKSHSEVRSRIRSLGGTVASCLMFGGYLGPLIPPPVENSCQ